MRKYILSVLTFFGLFVLSGCGGDNISDSGSGTDSGSGADTTGNPAVEIRPTEMIINGDTFVLNVAFIKKVDSSYKVELSNFDLTTDSCTLSQQPVFSPDVLHLDGGIDSSATVNITGTFDQNCSATRYMFSATQKTTKDGKVDTRMFSVTYDSNNPDNPDGGGGGIIPVPSSGFFNATTPLEITQASSPYEIKVQMIEDGYVASGKTVKMKPFDSKYGGVDSYEATTGADGYAVFSYTSPNVLPVNGTSAFFELTHDNGTVITQNIVLKFNTSGGGGVNPYNLVNPSTPIEVTGGNQDHSISAYVVDASTGIGVAGKTVTITTLANGYGSVNTSTSETDDAGKVEFIYTSPASIAGLTSTTAKMRFTEDGITSEQEIVINFTVPPGGGTQYSLINATNLVITATNDTKEISVDLTDTATGVGVPAKDVSITTISNVYGTITPSTVQTNASGKAIFTYTSPTTLINGNTTATLRFVDDTGNVITEDITIVTIPPSGGSTQYSFINETNLTVTAENITHTLYVDLINTATGVGESGKDVTISTISSTYGSVSPSVSTTDAAGRAFFTYTSPTQLISGATTATFSFTDSSGNTVTKVITITTIPAPAGGSQYSLINLSNIIIEHGSQKEDVKAQLTYKGIPIAGKTVQMLAFSATHGTILNSYNVITDSVGYATFVYMAPETLDDVNGTTINLTIQFDEELIHLEANASIAFSETQDNIDGNVTLPIVVIPSELRNVELDSNNQTFLIAIQVFKDIAPYGEGTVKVELPDKVLNGIDVGQFLEYEVAVNPQGTALFSYTGPSNLQSLIDNDDNESIFKFYHVENTASKQEMKVVYKAPSNPNVDRNYGLEVLTAGDFSMGIPNQVKTFNVLLTATDASGNEIILGSEENITKITVSSENTAIAQIWDPVSKTSVDSLILTGDSFTLKSKTLSGLVPVKVIMEFKDVNGNPQVLTTIVNVRVFSGPASAISISYVSTGQDVERAKYIETLAISVTDEYGNKVNTRPNISLGAIVGYAVDGHETSGKETNETKRLFYGRSDIVNDNANGEIIALGANTANFEDNTPARTDVFKYVNAEGNNTDKLVVFGERKNYEAMGKWDITRINNTTLQLQDDYFGVDRSGLYYAVGHNYYQDQCREDGREWVGSTDSETYQLDEEGTVTVTYKYDYHLTGKDALIWVNLDGIQPDTGTITRVGETVKHTLRGTGFTKAPTLGYVLSPGAAGYATFIIWHENAPERYRNAHFAYAVKDRGTPCAYSVVAQSNPFDARTCNNTIGVDTDNNVSTPDTIFGTSDGTSYITFYLEDTGGRGCGFDIDNITVSSEF